MELHANSSNNTIYADADGNIAYFHANFVPRRDPKFDWTKPVDGSDPETDWKGLLSFEESPNLFNPASGWVYNSNNSPWSAAGASSLKQTDFPKYVDNGIESARGLHAIRVLENRKDFTLEKLREAAYDSYLPWFEKTVPALVAAWDKLPANDPSKSKTERANRRFAQMESALVDRFGRHFASRFLGTEIVRRSVRVRAFRHRKMSRQKRRSFRCSKH